MKKHNGASLKSLLKYLVNNCATRHTADSFFISVCNTQTVNDNGFGAKKECLRKQIFFAEVRWHCH